MTKAKEWSRWRLDEAVRGETAVDSTDRVAFEFPQGEVRVEAGSPDEAVLARVLTQTGHVVPLDANAKAVALDPPPAPPVYDENGDRVIDEPAVEEPAPPPAEPKKAKAVVTEQQPPAAPDEEG